jgi:predicted DNA-binding antitoxin AbrB/MazE fold protein
VTAIPFGEVAMQGSVLSNHLGTVRAVYQGGTFHPREPVELPEGCEVVFELRSVSTEHSEDHRKRVHALLARSFETGEPDMAARHDEPLA